MEEGRQTVAKREWALLESELESTPEGKALALRKPHLNNAKAVLKAAKSGLAKSKLALDRTTITAPFNALVREESVELGGLVSPQTALASLVGTRQFWVQASVPVQHLGHIGVDAPHKPPAVTLTQATGSTPLTRQGRVLRILGDLDPQGRMARVIIGVNDPLALEPGHESLPPLRLGAYVTVRIDTGMLKGGVQIPRIALRDDHRIWVATPEETLSVRDIEVVWRTEHHVYIRGAITNGARVITSKIPYPVPGMKLQILGEYRSEVTEAAAANGKSPSQERP